MSSKQQIIQQFRNRLARNASPYGEYILSNPQFDSAVDDALGLLSSVKYAQKQGTVTITANEEIIPLPLDFADGVNDDLLQALGSGANISNYKYTYSPYNFGYSPINPYLANTYVGYSGSGNYYGRQNLSNPIIPPAPTRKRPELTTTVINGITYPAIIADPIPTSDQTLDIIYQAKQSITDDTLVITFSALPANGNTFVLDGATFTVVNTTPATDYQVQLAGTVSLFTANMVDVLENLSFIATASGQSISISNNTGTLFAYSIAGLTNATAVYTSGVDTVESQYKYALFDLIKAKGLEGLIAQRLIEDKKIDEIERYCSKLIEVTLLRLNT